MPQKRPCTCQASGRESAIWPRDLPIDLPLWGAEFSRPRWWGNKELRVFLTASHRKLTMAETRAEALRRFGKCVPSQSALHRYWQRLDALQNAGSLLPQTMQVSK